MKRFNAALWALGLATLVASPVEAGPRIELSTVGGATFLDQSLADFQWEITPRVSWGGQAAVRIGRTALGVRLLRQGTEQDTGLIDPPATSVGRTSVDVVARFTAARILGTDAWLGASAGWMHLGFSPDEAVIDLPSGSDITVEFDPINEAVFGLGAGVSKEVAPRWAIGLGAERTLFGLDTAHRRGDDIVETRESFGDWNVRMELTWVVTPG
jgi:hypothetical protein